MKKILQIILIIMLSTSCATGKVRLQPKQRGIDKTFEPYILSYKYLIRSELYEEKFKKLNMNFTDLEEYVVGRCYWFANNVTEIEIDKTWWEYHQYDFIAREFVVYHELEHCIRNRPHSLARTKIKTWDDFIEEIQHQLGFLDRSGYFKDGCPDSLMHPDTLEIDCRKNHYIDYLKEIKNYKKD